MCELLVHWLTYHSRDFRESKHLISTVSSLLSDAQKLPYLDTYVEKCNQLLLKKVCASKNVYVDFKVCFYKKKRPKFEFMASFFEKLGNF